MALSPPNIREFEPVREFTGDHRRLATTLLKVLEELRLVTAEMLVKGSPKDFAEYRHACGKIEGLDIAIAQCKKAQAQL